mgnify:CR=1 FL=1
MIIVILRLGIASSQLQKKQKSSKQLQCTPLLSAPFGPLVLYADVVALAVSAMPVSSSGMSRSMACVARRRPPPLYNIYISFPSPPFIIYIHLNR